MLQIFDELISLAEQAPCNEKLLNRLKEYRQESADIEKAQLEMALAMYRQRIAGERSTDLETLHKRTRPEIHRMSLEHLRIVKEEWERLKPRWESPPQEE